MNDTTNTNKLPFEFTGKAGEYFGIWIVNVLLTVVTLTLYTPWAKVRTRRYFYGNTLLDNSAFDYTAEPWALLKGYLVALGFFILYYMGTNFYPLLLPILMLVFLMAMPWLVVRSMMFNAFHSVYRNMRFSFKKNYGGAAAVFIGWPLLMPLTLGLIFPFIQFKQKKFFVENSSFGQSEFKFHATPGGFYKVYWLIMLFVVLGVIGMIAAIAIPAYHNYVEQARMGQMMYGRFINAADDPGIMMLSMAISQIATLLFYIGIFAYIQARVGNLVWNNVELASNRFESKLRARDLFWIFFSNIFMIVISFGLLIPWARVRMAKYRASKLSMLAVGDLNGFIKSEQDQVGATGDQVGEMFDMDIGL
ncbi:MAG: YjgN family protein [Gammaproteobacteria bacterium]|nr:YjgN family protein [Gammaproteobacteria bacterium]MDH5653267.1 YjgN family protein [Gammaproteobacteria bacterium]